jgi:hypothetical protein
MTSSASFRTAAALVAIVVAQSSAAAQPSTVNLPPNPAVIHTTTSVTISGAFVATPGPVTENSFQANPCNPGACFDAPVTVQANSKWQLQVTLNPAPTNFIVVWVESRSPIVTHSLTAGVYQTVASGTGATPGQNVALLFNANKTTGQGGFVPTAAQLAAVLSYRVIAAP